MSREGVRRYFNNNVLYDVYQRLGNRRVDLQDGLTRMSDLFVHIADVGRPIEWRENVDYVYPQGITHGRDLYLKFGKTSHNKLTPFFMSQTTAEGKQLITDSFTGEVRLRGGVEALFREIRKRINDPTHQIEPCQEGSYNLPRVLHREIKNVGQPPVNTFISQIFADDNSPDYQYKQFYRIPLVGDHTVPAILTITNQGLTAVLSIVPDANQEHVPDFNVKHYIYQKDEQGSVYSLDHGQLSSIYFPFRTQNKVLYVNLSETVDEGHMKGQVYLGEPGIFSETVKLLDSV